MTAALSLPSFVRMRGRRSAALAVAITRAASRQTDLTIRWLVDRDRVADAYRAYAYFRWLDDCLDRGGLDRAEQLHLVESQQALLERCLRGDGPPTNALLPEEVMLVDLVRTQPDRRGGLESYLRNMMAVIRFDADRRGRLISERELDRYTAWLAVSVTEALHYFIGQGSFAPHDENRYMAATGAHIAHLLRDAVEDAEAGYFNIPRETLDTGRIGPGDVHSDAYRSWVRSRVAQAHRCMQTGRSYLGRVENLRCRVAGLAYQARFAGVLTTIEGDGYCLRAAYPRPGALAVGTSMASALLATLIPDRHPKSSLAPLSLPERRL
jgi:phytoene/squalene synthetase